MENAILKIIPNIKCRVFVDSEMVTIAPENIITKLPLRVGEYYVQLISVDYPNNKVEDIIKLENDKVWKVQFKVNNEEALQKCNNNAINKLSGSAVSVVLNYDYIDGIFGNTYIVRKGSKYGLIDRVGNEILPCHYEYIIECDGDFFEGLARISRNGKWGFESIRYGGRPSEAIPCIYDSATDFQGGLSRVIKEGEIGFIDVFGHETIPCNNLSDFIINFPNANLDSFYNYRYSDCDGLRRIKKDNFLELIDINGRILTKRYKSISYFYEGLACVEGENGKCGYIDKTGKEVIPCIYENAGAFQDGLAGIIMDGKHGYIDKAGTVIVPCIYDPDPYDGYSWYPGFKNGYAIVARNKKWGIIDKTGKEVIPCIYYEARNEDYDIRVLGESGWKYYDNKCVEMAPYESQYLRAVHLTNGKCGYARGEEVVRGHYYDETNEFYCGLAKVKNYGSTYFINENFESVIRCYEYEQVGDFDRGNVAVVKKDGKYGFINTNGEEVVPCIYDRVYSGVIGLKLPDHMFVVENNRQTGIIDNTGKEVVPCIYESIGGLYSFGPTSRYNNSRYISVQKDGKCGFLHDYKEITPCRYDKRDYSFENNLAEVRINNKCGVINESGKEVLPCIYGSVSISGYGLISVNKEGKCGVLDNMGREVIPCIYDFLNVLDSNSFLVGKDGYQMIVDASNNVQLCIKR